MKSLQEAGLVYRITRWLPCMVVAAVTIVVVPGSASAQDESIDTPFRWKERGTRLGLVGGYIFTNRGDPPFGPGSSALLGTRFRTRLSSPLSLEIGIGYGNSDEYVIDPRLEGGPAVVDTVSAGPTCLNSRMLVPDGDSVVYFTNDGDSRLYVIDASTNTVRRSMSTEWDVDTMFHNPRLSKVYLCQEALDDNIHVFDCRTETITRTLSVDYRYVGTMNLLNDKLYLGGRDNPVVNVLHCPSDSVVEVLEGPGGFARSMAWNQTDNRVYVGREDRILVYRDFTTGAADRRPVFGPGSHATVVRRMQPLSVSQAGMLLDVTGRKVMALAQGRNDISGLAPGAYFIRRKPDGTTSRVVLLR